MKVLADETADAPADEQANEPVEVSVDESPVNETIDKPEYTPYNPWDGMFGKPADKPAQTSFIAPTVSVIEEPKETMPVKAVKKEKPSWLGAWVGELQATPPTHTVKPIKSTSYYTGYNKSWGKPSNDKIAEKKSYFTAYKPSSYVRKKYTAPPVSYKRTSPPASFKRPLPKIEVWKSPVSYKPKKPKKYRSEESDEENELKTYFNKYSGTPQKPHSHKSCLGRYLSRFSR